MSLVPIVLITALLAPGTAQDEAALEAGLASAMRAETRSEVRVFTIGGPAGTGGLDADGDGVVTREEFSAPMGTAFDRLDADDDGRLTTEELAAGHSEGPGSLDGPGPHVMTLRRSGGPEGHGRPMIFHGLPDGEGGDVRVFTFRRGGPEGEPDAAGPGERHVEVRRFGGGGGHGSMDADNDGKVSETEFLAPMREVFQSMDADGDGSLAEGEGHHAPPQPPAD